MAVSIFLLEFYNALFERSCDAINALAHALSTFYARQGFIPLNQKVHYDSILICEVHASD
jgi:hypothetical protein